MPAPSAQLEHLQGRTPAGRPADHDALTGEECHLACLATGTGGPGERGSACALAHDQHRGCQTDGGGAVAERAALPFPSVEQEAA